MQVRQNATECGMPFLGGPYLAATAAFERTHWELLRGTSSSYAVPEVGKCLERPCGSLARPFTPCQGPAEQNYRCMHVNHHGNHAGRLPGGFGWFRDISWTKDVLGEVHNCCSTVHIISDGWQQNTVSTGFEDDSDSDVRLQGAWCRRRGLAISTAVYRCLQMLFIYIYTHIYIHTHIYVYIYIRICVCVCIYIYVCVCEMLYIYIYTGVGSYVERLLCNNRMIWFKR